MTLLRPIPPSAIAAAAMKPAKRPHRPPSPTNGQPQEPRPALLTACEFIPQGDGSYRAVPRKPQDTVPAKEAARLANFPLTSIYRLYRAGFITGERQSPRRILIDVASLQTHLEAVRDPAFWTADRRLRYWGV